MMMMIVMMMMIILGDLCVIIKAMLAPLCHNLWQQQLQPTLAMQQRWQRRRVAAAAEVPAEVAAGEGRVRKHK